MRTLETIAFAVVLLVGLALIGLAWLPEGRTCLGSAVCIDKVRR